ncbi:hypothetical protein WMY93_000476 [Mugilogobius chulae]|uniref:Junctional protein associated with coronary artery disease n=1 Tax=Mugilogobius chulae TaxID=88201 RepID=A0AAW0Q7M9_9GOBI
MASSEHQCRGGPAHLSWIQTAQERPGLRPAVRQEAVRLPARARGVQRHLQAGAGRSQRLRGERAASSLTGIYGTTRQALVKAYPSAEGEGPDRILRRKDMAVGVLQDGQVVDSLAVDSGFYDVPSLTYSDPLSLVSLGHDDRDLSYWRRRGQDFSLLLDYADGRELRASTTAWRPQALLTAEELRAERQAQQLWEDLSWLRDPDSAPGQLRVTEEERKCQSLGNEEWRPAVSLGRSDSEDRWALDPYRLRTPDGFFHAKSKAKSQSLPRVLSPEGNTCRELVPSRPSLPDRQRMSSTVFSGPYSRYVYGAGRERWARSSGPASHQALKTSILRDTPADEGSAEMLALEQGAKQKDRLAYYSRSGDFRQDYYAQQAAITGMEPPGYIPPPSYKRPLPPRAVSMNRHEMANLRWRADTLQMPNSDPGRWLTRQTRSWVGYYADRASSYRRQISVPPGNEEQINHQRQLVPINDHPRQLVPIADPQRQLVPVTDPPRQLVSVMDQQRQFLPITSGEDPKPKPISGGPSGNMLTDSEKAVRSATTIKDISSAKSLGQSTLDSAFPPLQSESCITSRSFVRAMRKSESVGPEQTRSQFFPSSILGKPPPPPVKPPVEQAVAETMTETKKVEAPESLPPEKPEKEKDKTKNLKKRLSETIFCLVSVPVTPQPTMMIRDQNNNNEKSPDPADSPTNNKTGHLTNQSLQSTSSAEAELQALTASFASSKTSSRSSSKMFKKASCRPPKINHYKELKLTGAWPANQYRDQETQTSPEAEKPENKEAQVDGTVGVIDHNAVGTAFTFPMKGIKSLKLSSNSAFSITATFSNQISQASGSADEPDGEEEEEEEDESEKEGFDPYIIKPASRAWDAVKELEAIKKEVQEQEQQQKQQQTQTSKQPSVDKCIEDLNEAYKDILELGTAGNKVPNGSVQIPERIKIRLTSEPLNKPSSLRRSAVSWSVDPEYREVKSAFSRPATKSVTFSKQLREELPVPPRETGFREYRVVAHLSRRRSNDGRTVKLDLSDEPIETPLCDFSPTTLSTAAEVPWADRQPMQDASTLTSPPDYEDICQTLRQSRDPADASGSGSKANEEMMQDIGADSEEECPICKREMENQMRQGPLPPLHEENSSDSSTNQNASPPQRGASESPPENEKATEASELDKPGSSEEAKEASGENTDNGKDCDQVGTSNEIGVNTDVEENKDSESTLALVPVDTQELSEGQKDGNIEEVKAEAVEVEASAGEVTESSAEEEKLGEAKLNECKDVESKVEEQDKKPLVSPEHRLSLWTQLGRDPAGLPEFPPDRLPLSVPPTLDRRLSLSLEGERKSRGLSHRIEALQNKLAISPGRVAVERISRMREVDVICRVRRLSIRSTDSGEGDNETEGKKEEDSPELSKTDNTTDTGEEQEVAQSQKDPEETRTRDEEPSTSAPTDPTDPQTPAQWSRSEPGPWRERAE